MSESEWLEVVQRIHANWPHANVPELSLRKWYEDLSDLPVGYVVGAVESTYREGEKFPPNGGQIRRKAVEMQLDAPQFAEAWRLVLRAARKFGRDRGEEAFAWLRDRHVMVMVLAKRMGWSDVCTSTEPQVIHGQARRVWDGLTVQAVDETVVRGLDSGGLNKLERINRGPVPLRELLP